MDSVRTQSAAAAARHGWRRAIAVPMLASLLGAGIAFAGPSGDPSIDPLVDHAAGPAESADGVAAVIAWVDSGRFEQAQAAIAKALQAPGLAAGTERALRFQRERMRRILLDFSLDRDDVRARVRKAIPDLTDAEFAKWDAAGLLERMTIDGRTRYFNRSPSNLFRLSEEALARRAEQTPLSEGPMESPNAHQRRVRALALAGGDSSVAPQRVRITQSLTVDADAVPAGESVRAWIPFPRAIAGLQEDIRLLASEPAQRKVAPESTLQRSVHLEKLAQAGQPTEFSISYEFTRFGQYHAIDPDKVVAADIPPELATHLGERPPHIVFTDDLRAFSREVVGDETNPYRIAQTLFAAVDAIPWAGAREYSTISNISDYALHAGHADCGQQTLLLMALLRLNGIPARWQSGMVYAGGVDADGDGSVDDNATDSYWNLHDWGWLYLAPYGWVPMDVTTGRFQGDSELEWFYLGGVDAFRIAFNDDYGTPLDPQKTHFRSETVDSQRGEVEWDGGNLYFDQWDYDFEVVVLPQQATADTRPSIRHEFDVKSAESIFSPLPSPAMRERETGGTRTPSAGLISTR